MHPGSTPPKPEILAPAGNREAFMAAIEAGADALYLGLKRFNVRDRTENFTFKDLERLIPYAHKRSVKIYPTFNSILKELELVGALKALAILNEMKLDGLIVTDWGLVSLIRKHFPTLKLHASTQLSVHNRQGLEMLAQAGFQRVILARELTLDELAILADHPPLELEVFVHGALCFAYGGQCLISSYHGGRSANRGMCTQGCRRLFRYETPDGERRGTIFSASDLSSLPHVGALARMGIHSFKIEGRQRSAEYVYKAVQAYRKAVDARPENRAEAMAEAQRLAQADMGRKKTDGHMTRPDGRGVVQEGLSGNTGIYLGRIETAGKEEFMLRCPVKIRKGDRVRVHALATGEGKGFRLDRFSTEETTREGKKSYTYKIHSTVPARPGDLVYKIGSASFQATLHQLRKAYDAIPAPEAPGRRIGMQISLRSDGIRLELSAQPGSTFQRDYPVEILPSDKPLEAEILLGYLARAGDTPFHLAESRFIAEPDAPRTGYIPPSRLKAIRRLFFTEAEKEWAVGAVPTVAETEDRHFAAVDSYKKEFSSRHARPAPAGNTPATWALRVPAFNGPRLFGRYLDLFQKSPRFTELVAPIEASAAGWAENHNDEASSIRWALPVIIGPAEIDEWRRRLDRLRNAGAQRFLLGHFSQRRLFDESFEGSLASDTSFNVMNSEQVGALAAMGLDRVALSMECDRKLIEKISRTRPAVDIEVVVYGAPPVLFARMVAGGPSRFEEGKSFNAESERGDRYGVERSGGFTWIRSRQRMSTLTFAPEMERMGIHRFRVDLQPEECKPDFLLRLLESVDLGKKIPETTSFNYEFGVS